MRRLASAASLAAMPSPAAVRRVNATSPARVADPVRQAGYRATVCRDFAGDPGFDRFASLEGGVDRETLPHASG